MAIALDVFIRIRFIQSRNSEYSPCEGKVRGFFFLITMFENTMYLLGSNI